MKGTVSIRLITNTTELPDFPCHDFFHSVDFFNILENSSKMDPCMALAEDGQGNIIAHMLVVISYHNSLFPPMLYLHGHIYGEGEYTMPYYSQKEAIFGRFLEAITNKFSIRMCLYLEVSDLSNKMLCYEDLKNKGFFRIQWQEIHNSLHNIPPESRITTKVKKEIEDAERRGLTSGIAELGTAEFRDAYKLLKSYFRFKPRRTIPSLNMIEEMVSKGYCRVFVTKLNKHIIGTCACIYTNGNSYMWHFASRRKTYMLFHPDTYTLWTALKHAHSEGCAHMYFMDVGMPFKRNKLRDFILEFGGKPVSKYRWFKTQIPAINHFLDWCYNE